MNSLARQYARLAQHALAAGDRHSHRIYLRAAQEVRQYAWKPYEGPRGGKGWKNTETDQVVYGEHAPGDSGSSLAHESSHETDSSSVTTPPENSSSSPTPSRVSRALHQAGSVVMGLVKKAGHQAGHVEHVVGDFLGSGVDRNIDRLPAPVRAPVSATWWLTKLGTRLAFATYIAGQQAAETVAEEAGATPEEAATLRKVCTAVDVAGAKVVPLVFGAVGLGGVGVAGSFLPAGSTAYLAYSTVMRPGAVLRAAKRGVKALLTRKKKAPQEEQPVTTGPVQHAKRGEVSPQNHEELRRVLEALRAHQDDQDTFLACLYAALDETESLEEALEVAEEVYREQGEELRSAGE